MNTVRSGISPWRCTSSPKISASGLITFSSPDTMMSSNHCRKAKRSRATGKVSADQLVSASSRTGSLRSCSSRATDSGSSPFSVSGQRRW